MKVLLIICKLLIIFFSKKKRKVYDKVHSQKGNSPEYKLKSYILFLVNKLLTFFKTQDVVLEADIFKGKRKCSLRLKMNGSKCIET